MVSDSSKVVQAKVPRDKVNRFVIFGIYAFIVFTTGAVYWGWTGVQELLYKAGTYEDACLNAPDVTRVIIGGVSVVDCGKRKNGINSLFTICYALHFMFSFLGGVTLDKLGPWICFVIGHVMNGVAWGLVFFFPKSVPCLYIGFILIGLFIEASYTPMIVTLCEYFPSSNSTVISIMGSLRSLSYFTPSIMSALYGRGLIPLNKLYIIGIVYICIGNGLAVVLSAFIVPGTKKSPIKSSKGAASGDRVHDGKGVQGTALENVSRESGGALASGDGALSRPGSGSGGRVQGGALKSRSGSKSPNRSPSTSATPSAMSSIRAMLVCALHHPQLGEFILVLLTSCLFIASIEFLNKAQRELLITSSGDSAVEIFKYTNCLTFLPGPPLGYLMDRVGPAIVMNLLHVTGLLYYVSVATDVYAMKVLACFAYLIAGSLAMSSIYCYINERFPKRYFGTLVSGVFFFSGSLSLLNIPLYSYATASGDLSRFKCLALVMLGYVGGAAIFSAALIYISRIKMPVPWHKRA